jgi:O-antigen ligase
MVLMLTLGIGLTFGYASRAGALARPTIRDRVIWLASPAGYRVFVSAAAVAVMLCAATWTMSRSGIVATGCALTVFVAGAAWRARGVVQRGLVVAYAACLIAGVVAWRGADTLVTWYGNTATWQWRVQLWRDTMPALREFWVAGAGLYTYQQLMLIFPRSNLQLDPVQAHNDYLQLAVEGGLLVSIPVLLLILAIARRIIATLRAPQEELHWWVRMGAVAGLCGLAVQEISEFSLQVPGVALLYATALAVAVHTPQTARASSRRAPGQPPQDIRARAA